jgi:serine/threonine protein kinase
MLTEFIEGMDVYTLNEKWKLNIETIYRMTRQSIEKIGVLMGEKIGHGDIKPQNIIGSTDLNRFSIIDLDFLAPMGEISMPLECAHETKRMAYGTREFMAQEHQRGRYEISTDLHALAKSTISLLLGEDCSHRAYARRHVESALYWKKQDKKKEAGGLLDFAFASMDEDWRKRPQTPQEALDLLDGT